jgi:hypothetical protein
MTRFLVVLCRVPVLGAVAAPDVTAGHANPQMHPLIAALQAFLASLRPWGDILYLILMGAYFSVIHVLFLYLSDDN